MKSPELHQVKKRPQTKRQKTEKTLNREESFFTSIFESIQDGISILDKEMNIIQINPVMGKWYSHALPLVGKKCYEAYHSRTERCEVCPSHRTITTGKTAFEVVPKRGPGGKVTGWLDLYSFPLMDVGTGRMTGVIEYVRDITEHKRAEEELLRSEEEAKQLNQENAIMAEIGRIISSTLEIDEVYERFAEEVKRLIPFDRISINIINPHDRTYTIAYHMGTEVPDRQKGTLIPLAGTVTEETARTRSPFLIQGEDFKALRNRFPGTSTIIHNQFPSMIMIPLLSKDRGIATLSLRSAQSTAYTARDVKLAERVGHQIAGHIANTQLFNERKQAEEELRRSEKEAKRLAQENAVMAEIGRIVSSTLDIEKVYERFAEEVRKVIPFDRIVIDLSNPEQQVVTITYVSGIDIVGRRMGDVIPYGGSDTEHINNTRSSLFLQTEDEKDILKHFPALLPTFRAGIRSMMSAPLISKDQIIGGLHIRSFRANAYTESELRLAERIGNQIAGAIANAQLFAERKQAEEALQTQRRRFQILSEYAPFGMVMIDRKGTYQYINPKFRELFGYDLMDIPDGKTWFRKAYPNPTYRRHVISTWMNDLGLFPLGEKRPRVYTVTCKNGAEKIVAFISVQLEMGENLMTCEDITEHVHFEEALRESEEKYRTLFEGSTDAVYIATREGKFLDFNQAFLDLFGYRKEELMGLNDRETYVQPEDWHRFQREIENKGFVRDFEVKLRKQNGKEMDCLVTASLRRDGGGILQGHQGFIRDITERRQTEQEMKLLEEQLRQSQKMEAIGRLAGGIAHDFNNLLTIMKGYSQLSLLEVKEGDPLRENLENIHKATDRASDLIRKILAFSRRQMMELRVVDLNTLLTDLDKLLRRIIGEDIDLVTLLAKDLGRVKVDPGQIEQVILNLAVNAKDAMPNGGKLTIETANVALDEAYTRSHISVISGRYVMLSMSDSGVGMTPEVKERIFEPFYTTKDKDKGTGLGLSIVYGIVKQSGGNIWVYSEPGHGTSFKIYLPREEEPLEKISESVLKRDLPRGTETVLIVEDEADVRQLAARILKKQGYRVLEASQGDQALRICEQYKEPIHLLITDVIMPGMSGRDLSESMKPLRPETKVLYMSGHTSGAIVHHGVIDPSANLLQKPFTPEALARKMREVLDQ